MYHVRKSVLGECLHMFTITAQIQKIFLGPQTGAGSLYLDLQHFGYQAPWLVCVITMVGIIIAVLGISKSSYLNKNTSAYHVTT